MPLYEYRCKKCGARDELFVRSVNSEAKPPKCPGAKKGERGHTMVRIVSGFARKYTEADKLADAEARWGNEVESMMTPSGDIDRGVRVYDALSKGKPSKEDA